MAAANTDKFKKAKRKFATTVGVGGIAQAATTLPLTTVSGLDTDTAVTVIVAPGESSEEVITGVVSASNLVNCVRGLEGTSDQSHNAGDTVVMYFTETHWDDLIDGILADHSQSGGHEVATNYDPSNPTLETQKWVGVASAVNELTVKNAITATPVRLLPSGGDTNIDLYLSGKGTGSPRFAGPHDGWIACDETLTYASATTFTCSSALAAVFSTGDKIKLTQTTVKYFYVVSVSGTTVTVTGGADYSLANAAITSPFYSKGVTPVGFPTEFAWTPTFANFTVGSATLACKFTMNGKWVNFRLSIALSSSTMGTAPTFTLPVTSATMSVFQGLGPISLFDSSAPVNVVGHIRWASTTTADMVATDSNSTFANHTNITSTVPFTWANNDVITGTGQYVAA